MSILTKIKITTQMFVEVCRIECYPTRTKYAPYTSKILFTPSKYGFPYIDFHKAKTWLNEITWRYPVPDCTEIGQEIWEVWVFIPLRKAWLSLRYFNETHACSTSVQEQFPYQISWKSHTRFSRW
jgi:hypothetical protein